MQNYNQLLRRLDSLGDPKTTRIYSIYIVTDAIPLENRKVYSTPDEALRDIYEDAHKRGITSLHLELEVFDAAGLAGNFLGYAWSSYTADSKHILVWNNSSGSSVRIWGCPICGQFDPLAYPNPAPEFELFNLVGALMLDWCQSAGYRTIESYEDHAVQDLNRENPRHWTIEDMDMNWLIRQYRNAGYNVDYPREICKPEESTTYDVIRR